jgi:uncharacterized UPF0146 family protein
LGRIFQLAQQYLDQIDPGEFVEIGCGRPGDDGSTPTLANWANQLGSRLITVDIDPANCDFVQEMNIANVDVVNSTGEDYLRHRIYSLRPISFLYLDNFDWDWHPDQTDQLPPLEFAPNGRPVVGIPGNAVLEQQYNYRQLGLEMTNVNSQRAHLAQAVLAIHHMAARSLIVCDDTWYNPWWGHYSGKSGSAVPFLLNRGYQVLYSEEQPVYGTILGRGI